jgi:Na+-driven multidrug efflux pump
MSSQASGSISSSWRSFFLSSSVIFRSTLQGLGQSVVPTIAGVMELVMRAGAALILCEIWGFLGACWASPLAWIGSAIPLMIAYYWTRRSFRHKMVGIEG